MSNQQESTLRIYRPLAELKYLYQSLSRPSSVQAETSSELPLIPTKRKHADFSTQSHQYSTTINDTLKMKLKTGQIYDQISLIDQQLREDKERYSQARSKHEKFAKAFEEFLSKQYQQVKQILRQLDNQELESTRLKDNLQDLRQTITEKSLKIYELETKWRRYKTCEKFLLHISPLLRNDPEKLEPSGNFRVDPEFETPTLEELIKNFKKFDTNVAFENAQYEHVTAARVVELFSKLKRQNLKILRYKLEQEKLTNVLEDVGEAFEKDFERKVKALEKEINDWQTRAGVKIEEGVMMQRKCDIVTKDAQFVDEDNEKLKTFVEELYAKCFRPKYQETSHVEMVRFMEDYCHSLLCELYSFEPSILKKVLR